MNTGRTSDAETRYLRIRSMTDHDRVAVCEVRGELDMCTAPALERGLDEYGTREGTGIVLELSQVEFCGVAGIAVVEEANRRARADRRWLAVVGSRAVRRIARLVDCDDTIRWYPTLAAALEAADAAYAAEAADAADAADGVEEAACEPAEETVPAPRTDPARSGNEPLDTGTGASQRSTCDAPATDAPELSGCRASGRGTG